MSTEPVGGTPEEPSYADAAAELARIIEALDHDEIDVDRLGAQVARAADLIRLCRDRIVRARMEVEEVVSTLELDLESEA